MSWIFGAFGDINLTEKKRLERIINNHINHVDQKSVIHKEGKNFWVTAGGNSENILFGKIFQSEMNNSKKFSVHNSENEDYIWISVGMGVIRKNGFYRLMSNNDWKDFFISEDIQFENLNGHFCSVIINNSEINIFTDQLGTRDIYFIQKEWFFVFSTRLDLLTKYKGYFDIDFRAMGSLWLLESQINTGTIIKNINRLTSSAVITAKFLNKFEIAYSEKPWIPQISTDVSQDQLYDKLKELIYLPINENAKILLALSGGMDSRILLSILIELFGSKNLPKNYLYPTFETFTFGMPDDLDVEIPSLLSQNFGFEHKIYFEDFVLDDNTISELTKFICNTGMTFPVSEFLLKRNYNQLKSKRCLIIDGCWGEITRSSLFKRLIAMAPKEIKNRNSKIFFKYMFYPHSDIFDEEIKNIMIEGALEHLSNCLNVMPDFDDYSLNSWMDLFAIRTKQPNLVGIEQTRIDNLVRSFSPFVQVDFFNLIFSVDTEIKKNGTILKTIFKKHKNGLDKYPLNAGGVKIPFSYSSSSISIKRKILSVFSKKRNSYRTMILKNLDEYYHNIINSLSFVNFVFFDKKKINRIYLEYKQGSQKAERELDWFFTFELFRKGLTDE